MLWTLTGQWHHSLKFIFGKEAKQLFSSLDSDKHKLGSIQTMHSGEVMSIFMELFDMKSRYFTATEAKWQRYEFAEEL